MQKIKKLLLKHPSSYYWIIFSFLLVFTLSTIGNSLRDLIEGDSIIEEMFEWEHLLPSLILGIIGGVVGHFYGRKINEVKRQQVEIKENNKRSMKIISQMTDGLWIINNQKVITFVNQSFCQITGFSKEELEKSSVYSFLNAKSIPYFTEQLKTLNDSKSDSNICKINVIRKNGDPIVLRVASTLLKSDENDIEGIISVLTDITASQDLEKRRNEFIEVTNHELRTPLTIITGFIELIKDKKILLSSKQGLPIFQKLLGNIDRLKRLINSVDELSLIEQERFVLNVEETNVLEFLTNNIDSYKPLLGEQINFVSDHEIKPLHVMIDKKRFSYVIDNLIRNAVNHTRADNRLIYVQYLIENPMIRIIFSDNGVGIPKGNLNQIFEPFVSIPSDVWVQGTGIGLFISKIIIESHHGTIWAESEGKDMGSRFIVELPLNTRDNVS